MIPVAWSWALETPPTVSELLLAVVIEKQIRWPPAELSRVIAGRLQPEGKESVPPSRQSWGSAPELEASST